ncbi:MAG: HAD family phosphatase [Marinilabiliaceae bacterium]|nr:HAD family phosphatase [Marinilabiliaceae bacterium]
MKELTGIKNLIFDFGNVILDIDFQKTVQQFKNIGFKEIETFLKDFRSMGFFSDYQEGKISDSEFITNIQIHSDVKLTKDDIIKAWNSMLLNYNTTRLNYLRNLRNKYRIFLLSNTNNLHYENFANRVPGEKSIDNLFEKTYYSHIIKMSKPSVDIYQYVITDANIIASETLFIDDLQENIDGAKNAGLKACIVKYPSEWTEWF